MTSLEAQIETGLDAREIVSPDHLPMTEFGRQICCQLGRYVNGTVEVVEDGRKVKIPARWFNIRHFGPTFDVAVARYNANKSRPLQRHAA